MNYVLQLNIISPFALFLKWLKFIAGRKKNQIKFSRYMKLMFFWDEISKVSLTFYSLP